MSIILDALKKAEAERQRGQLPNLHAIPWTSAPQASSKRLALIASLGFLLCASAAWWTFRDKPDVADSTDVSSTNAEGAIARSDDKPSAPQYNEPNQSLIAQSQDTPGTQAATQVQYQEGASMTSGERFGPAPSLQAPLTGAPLLARVPESTMAAPEPVQQLTLAAKDTSVQLATPLTGAAAVLPDGAHAMSTAATNTANAGMTQQSAAAAANMPQNAAPQTSESAQLAELARGMQIQQAGAVPELYQLDYETRHALPKLALTLHAYHATPQRRFVIINNKRFGEGEQVDGKVTLLQIVRDGVECEFNGIRFLLPRQL
jgi:general secretion pathway protein B